MSAGQRPAQPGKVSAQASLVLGITASVAANVTNSWYASPQQLAAWTAAGNRGPWHPSPGAMAAAAFFPVSLLLTVEVLARVNWPTGSWWSVIRYCGTGMVALVAAFVSYLHMSQLLGRYGYDTWTAHTGPLSVDGLMLVAALALMTFVKPAERGRPQGARPPADSSLPVARANGSGAGRQLRDLEERARVLLAAVPGLTNAQLGDELGVSPSTGGRLKRRIRNGDSRPITAATVTSPRQARGAGGQQPFKSVHM